MVLEPSPVTHPENHDGSVVFGTKYGTAMLYRIGAPVSQAIAPVTYMWYPISQQNMSMELDGSNESMKVDIDFCEKSDRMQDSALFRQLWVWIHASAFQEGEEFSEIDPCLACNHASNAVIHYEDLSEIVTSKIDTHAWMRIFGITFGFDNECYIEEVTEEDPPSKSSKDKKSNGPDSGKVNLVFKITSRVPYKTVLKAHSVVVLKAESAADKAEWINKISSVIQAKGGQIRLSSDGGSNMRQSLSVGSLDTMS
ncbi:hypothetical protein RIF29_29650 [Crotalaria pallida]|uniref:PH domain-containing protein n=1 Tax=Crotalaria pallida TaxID=3830 RepID=A0AAN9EF56_CROPI